MGTNTAEAEAGEVLVHEEFTYKCTVRREKDDHQQATSHRENEATEDEENQTLRVADLLLRNDGYACGRIQGTCGRVRPRIVAGVGLLLLRRRLTLRLRRLLRRVRALRDGSTSTAAWSCRGCGGCGGCGRIRLLPRTRPRSRSSLGLGRACSRSSIVVVVVVGLLFALGLALAGERSGRILGELHSLERARFVVVGVFLPALGLGHGRQFVVIVLVL